MPLPILVAIGIVPVKPRAILQGIHEFSIRLSYTNCGTIAPLIPQ
jgi:hypothetical protein